MRILRWQKKRHPRGANTANKVRNVLEKREHITMVKEPHSKFIGFTTPTGGTGKLIADSMIDFWMKEDYCLDDLVAGYLNGIITNLEKHVDRPLQWLICLFHFNELPLVALWTDLKIYKTGPKTLSGTIGSSLITSLEQIPVNKATLLLLC